MNGRGREGQGKADPPEEDRAEVPSATASPRQAAVVKA